MPALNHRGLALKFAVESVKEYEIVDSDGEIDQEFLDGVLALADKFVEWLGTDAADTPVAAEAPAAVEAPTPAPLSTRDQLLQLAESKRSTYGSAATDALTSAIRAQVNGGVSLSTARDYVERGSLDSTIGSGNARDFAEAIAAL